MKFIKLLPYIFDWHGLRCFLHEMPTSSSQWTSNSKTRNTSSRIAMDTLSSYSIKEELHHHQTSMMPHLGKLFSFNFPIQSDFNSVSIVCSSSSAVHYDAIDSNQQQSEEEVREQFARLGFRRMLRPQRRQRHPAARKQTAAASKVPVRSSSVRHVAAESTGRSAQPARPGQRPRASEDSELERSLCRPPQNHPNVTVRQTVQNSDPQIGRQIHRLPLPGKIDIFPHISDDLGL